MKEKSITCLNSECKAENPANAKFCRKCGEPLGNEMSSKLKYRLRKMWEYLLQPVEWSELDQNKLGVFTPDIFPNIKFSPCSIVEINFKCKRGFISIIILIALIVLYSIFEYEIHSFFKSHFNLWISDWIPFSLCGLLFIIFIPFTIRCLKFLKYKCNADYIETYPFAQKFHRIAKNQKLGLFDKNRNDTILRAKYDNITLFDADHFLIERNCKRGLYSIRKDRFIVPIRYDKIGQFVNSIVKCSNDNQLDYYDINGHRMK